jgi:hypothetical protein
MWLNRPFLTVPTGSEVLASNLYYITEHFAGTKQKPSGSWNQT